MFTTLVPAPIYTSGVCKRQFFFIDLLSNFRSTFLLFISSFEYLTPLWSAADVISLERAFLYLHSNMFLLILSLRSFTASSRCIYIPYEIGSETFVDDVTVAAEKMAQKIYDYYYM